MGIRDSWNRLETLFRQEYPGKLDFLLPGATKDELQQFKICFDPVPEEIVTLWSIHNGEHWRRLSGIIPGFVWMSIDRMIERQLGFNDIAENLDNDQNNELEGDVLPVGAGLPYVFSQHALIFAENGASDFLVMDFIPGPLGSVGQVTHVGIHEQTRYILATGLEEFLELLIWIYNDPRASFSESPHYGLQFNWLSEGGTPINTLVDLWPVLYKEGKLYQSS